MSREPSPPTQIRPGASGTGMPVDGAALEQQLAEQARAEQAVARVA